MGLENNESTLKVFVQVIGGKFAIKVKEGTEGAVERINKKGAKIWELQYNTLSDVSITKIEKVVKEGFGASWEVTLTDGPDTFVLNLPYSGRVSNGFLHRLPNIDFSKPVTLKAFHFIKDENGNTYDIPKTYLSIEQEGSKVAPAYTKDEPNGLPPLEKVMRKGIEEWDDTKQGLFIEAMVLNQIQPKLKSGNVVDKSAFVATSSEEHEPDVSNDDLDLPF